MNTELEEERIEYLAEQIDPSEKVKADGYVYALRCTRESDGERVWYVGSTTDLNKRYLQHIKQSGDFSGPDARGRLRPTGEVEFNVFLDDVEVFWRCAKSDEELRQRMRRREQEKQCELAIDQDTNQVYGGR